MWPLVPIDGSDVTGGKQRNSSKSFAERASARKGHHRYRYQGRGHSVPWNEQQEDAGLNAFADAMHRHLNVYSHPCPTQQYHCHGRLGRIQQRGVRSPACRSFTLRTLSVQCIMISTLRQSRGCGCMPKESSDTKVAKAVIYFSHTSPTSNGGIRIRHTCSDST